MSANVTWQAWIQHKGIEQFDCNDCMRLWTKQVSTGSQDIIVPCEQAWVDWKEDLEDNLTCRCFGICTRPSKNKCHHHTFQDGKNGAVQWQHHAGMQCGDEQTHIFLCSTHSSSTICSVGSTQQTAWNQQSLTVTIFALASACSALLVDEHCWFLHSFVTSLTLLDCMFTALSCSSQDVCHFDVPAGYLASKKLHSTLVWCLSKFHSSVCLSVCHMSGMLHEGHVTVVANPMRGMSQWQLTGWEIRALMSLPAVFHP